jgi:hypothetical protein
VVKRPITHTQISNPELQSFLRPKLFVADALVELAASVDETVNPLSVSVELPLLPIVVAPLFPVAVTSPPDPAPLKPAAEIVYT